MDEIMKELIIALIGYLVGASTVYLTINNKKINIKGNNNIIAGNDINEYKNKR